jgi:hypothetical protein
VEDAAALHTGIVGDDPDARAERVGAEDGADVVRHRHVADADDDALGKQGGDGRGAAHDRHLLATCMLARAGGRVGKGMGAGANAGTP